MFKFVVKNKSIKSCPQYLFNCGKYPKWIWSSDEYNSEDIFLQYKNEINITSENDPNLEIIIDEFISSLKYWINHFKSEQKLVKILEINNISFLNTKIFRNLDSCIKTLIIRCNYIHFEKEAIPSTVKGLLIDSKNGEQLLKLNILPNNLNFLSLYNVKIYWVKKNAFNELNTLIELDLFMVKCVNNPKDFVTFVIPKTVRSLKIYGDHVTIDLSKTNNYQFEEVNFQNVKLKNDMSFLPKSIKKMNLCYCDYSCLENRFDFSLFINLEILSLSEFVLSSKNLSLLPRCLKTLIINDVILVGDIKKGDFPQLISFSIDHYHYTYLKNIILNLIESLPENLLCFWLEIEFPDDFNFKKDLIKNLPKKLIKFSTSIDVENQLIKYFPKSLEGLFLNGETKINLSVFKNLPNLNYLEISDGLKHIEDLNDLSPNIIGLNMYNSCFYDLNIDEESFYKAFFSEYEKRSVCMFADKIFWRNNLSGEERSDILFITNW
jgi:hypothetical protein